MMFFINCNNFIYYIDYGTYFSYIYKTRGEDYGLDDYLLTWAGSVGSIVNGATRLLMGICYDKIGFKWTFLIINLSSLINSCLSYSAVNYAWLYFICIATNYIAIGGVFAIFPASVVKVFGA